LASQRATAIYGSGATRIWIGTDAGHIFFFNGTSYTQVANFVNRPVVGLYVFGAAPNEQVVAAVPDAVARCSGSCDLSSAVFNETAASSGITISGLCGTPAGLIYLATNHSSGNSVFTELVGSTLVQRIYTSNTHEIRACAVLPEGRVLVPGQVSLLTWRPDAGSGGEFPNLSGLGADTTVQQWDAVAVNPQDGGAQAVGMSRRAMLRSQGANWAVSFNPSPPDAGLSFRAIINTAPGEYWAGGDVVGNQSLAYDTGNGFQFMTLPFAFDTYALWALDADTFYAAGQQGNFAAVWKAAR
jgi:hypothetical protein